jgi:hypothetical protein
MNRIKVTCIIWKKLDDKMKKRVLTIISIAFITASFTQASSKVEVLTNKTPVVNINEKKSKVTIEECKKHLVLENYNFINEIYSDGNVALAKCEKEIQK